MMKSINVLDELLSQHDGGNVCVKAIDEVAHLYIGNWSVISKILNCSRTSPETLRFIFQNYCAGFQKGMMFDCMAHPNFPEDLKFLNDICI